MADDTTYNGWRNYETWAVGMYLDGNYTGKGTYLDTIERLEYALEGNQATEFSTVDQVNRHKVADALKDMVQCDTDPTGYGDDDGHELHPLASDLLGAALSSVDWYELADAWIENLREQVTS